MNAILNLKATNKSLFNYGVFFLVAAVCTFVLSLVDATQVAGINRWYKPTKFSLSLWIYLWTLIIVFDNLPKKRWIKRSEQLIIFFAVGEIVLIALQAARGVASHFNTSTPFDAMVYGIMGLMIVGNTIVIIVLTIVLIRNKTINKHIRLAFAMALGALIIASLFGFWMTRLNSNQLNPEAVGAIIPFLSWNISALDLRISHFIGIHGLQVIPLAAYYILQQKNMRHQQIYIWTVSTVYYVLIFVPLFLG